MSDSPSGSGKHRRTGSGTWRQNPLLSKLNQRIGSITSKIPRPNASSKTLKRAEDSVKSKASDELPPFQKVPVPLSQGSVDVLATLDEGYFSANFDPLTHELKSLPTNVGQEELDGVVDKLAAALEVVSAQLSTHVLENHDRFVDGINTVASVEADLQQAHIVTCNARVNLRFALDEVKTNMRIAKQTQQKQGYMGILEHLSKLQHTQRLKQTLKEAQESGEYAEAFMRCAECFDHLESLGDVEVAVDLNKTVNTLVEETVMRVENALQAVCMDFRPDEYKRVLQGFMFQNITNQEVSAKVLHAFQDSIILNSMKVVRSLIVTKPNLAEELLSGRGDPKFTDMCQALPFDLLRPCLAKMLEVLYDAMCSYQHMAKWHEMMLKQMATEIASARGGPSEGTDDNGGDGSPGGATPKEIDDDSGMVEVMGSVHDTLVSSRKVVWDAAARKVRDLLSGPAAFEGDHFLQVMEWCQRFLSAGEAFIQEESEVLRSTITIQCGKFFETYHQTNLEAMEILLKSEQFVNISSHFDGTGFRSDMSLSDGVASGNMANMSLRDVLNSPSVFEIYPENDFDASDFDSWVDRGNPFRPEGSPRKRRKKDKRGLMLGFGGATNMGEDGASQRLDVDEHGVTRGDNVWSRQSTESFPSFSLSRKGTGDEEYDDEEEAPELFGEVIDEDTQMVRMGESSAEPGQTSGDGGVILTNSAHQMLKWMKNYGSLMRPLSSRSEDIFNGMCHLFDTYLLEVFLFVSGLSLESVIWEEDLMTTRLKSTLIRILTSDWSPYREEVERIRAAKPVAKSAPGTQKESKLTKDFKSLFQRGDKGNPTAQVNANGTSGGGGTGGDATPTHVHSGGAWERPAIKSSGNMYGLKETVVAIASIETLAQQLTESRSVLQTLLPPTASRTIDTYYRTVDSTEDLKEVGFRNAARRMLHEMLDPEKGITSQIIATQYDGEEISVSHNPWAHVLGENVSRFAELLGYANLPDEAVAQMWDHAMKAAGEVMLEGFSGVEKCSMGGRSMMSLDLTYVENIFKLLLPESSAANLRIVDTYIKAYYYAWEDIPTWAETHHVEYGPSKIAALVEHIAQRVKSLEGKEIKRSEIRQMKNRIEERMTQLMG